MWESIDIFMTKAMVVSARTLANLFLLALGLVFFLVFQGEIFEYNEGASDLSLLEVYFFLALYFLCIRHINRAKQSGMGFWLGLAKLLRGMGYLALSLLAVVGLLVAFLIHESGLKEAAHQLSVYAPEDALSNLIEYGVFLLAFYLSAPTGQNAVTKILSHQ